MPPSTAAAAHAPPTIILPSTKHTHTIVLLHGLGNNGDKFGHELVESGLSSQSQKLTEIFPCAKFIFPNALWRRSSGFSRVRITQWFDLYSVLEPSKRNELQLEGLAESFAYIRAIILAEMNSIPQENIILGGISQGCAMGLFTLLGLDVRLGAFFGMSGWLPFASDMRETIENHGSFFDEEVDQQPERTSPAEKARGFVVDLLLGEGVDLERESRENQLMTPVFLGHGAKDEKVRVALGEEAAKALGSFGVDVAWKTYPDLGHWYQVPDEIDDIVSFLKGQVAFPEETA